MKTITSWIAGAVVAATFATTTPARAYAEGTLYCWGLGDYIQPPPRDPPDGDGSEQCPFVPADSSFDGNAIYDQDPNTWAWIEFFQQVTTDSSGFSIENWGAGTGGMVHWSFQVIVACDNNTQQDSTEISFDPYGNPGPIHVLMQCPVGSTPTEGLGRAWVWD